MKCNKLFLSAALILAAACTKEAPQDNPVLPDGGKKVNITLSAGSAETKTYVSDPATGVIFWEAEDALGVFTDKDVTAPVKFELASGEGTASANFNGEIAEGATEVYVFYPYDENATFDLATKTITASIPATQQMGEQNVVHGAMLAMGIAAYDAESGTYGVTLHNAFSYLKIKIETEDVREINLGSGSVPFAGAAAVTLSESGVSVASAAGAVNTVTVKAPETGFTKDSYYYIPVLPAGIPAGEFSVYMTSDENGDWMAERISKSAMNFQLGKGLKFDTFDSIAEWFFNIRDYESLERFRSLVKDGEFPEGGLAKFTRDIDLSGKTLAAASGTFNGTLDGQGHSITNWTSEATGLFEYISGTVKNFSIDSSCSLQFSSTPGEPFGFVVAEIKSGGVLDGITNNTNITQSISVTGEGSASLSPLAGRSYGLIQNCINNGNISLTASAASKNIYLGGLVGYLNAGDKLALYKNTNNGDISYRVNAKGANVYIGGIAAGTSTATGIASATSSKGTADLCLNTGNVSYYSTNGGSMEDNAGTGGTGNYFKVGGIVGYWEGNITNCVNGVSGDATKGIVSVTVPTSDDAACATGPSIGGIAAFALRNVTDCTNYGPVRIKGTFAGGGTANAGCGNQANFCAGGVVGQAGPASASEDYSISGCNNYGALDFTGWMASSNGTQFFYGGVAGWLNIPILNSKNYGSMTVSSKGGYTFAGGVLGKGAAAASSLENHGDLDVSLLRTASTGNQSASGYHRIGGVVGHSNINLSGSTNYGKVIVRGDANAGKHAPLIGGITGQAEGVFESSTNKNEGDVEVHWPADGTNGLVVGGAIGWTGLSISNLSNSGNVTVEGGVHSALVKVGGVIGNISGGTHSGHNNSGSVSFTGTTLSAQLFVGGVAGWKAGAATLSNLTSSDNSKPITVNVTNQNAQFFIGGVVGRHDGTTAKTWTGIKNDKPINVTIGATSQTNFSYIGGVIANDQTNQTFTSDENYGDITYSGPYKMRIGGIAPYTNKATNSCKVECDITAACTGVNYSEIGGLIGYTAATGFTGDSFTGKINTSGSTAKVYTGGILGKTNGAQTFNGCAFSGDLTGANGNNVPGLYVGGLQATGLALTFGASSKCVVGAGSKLNGTVVTALSNDNLVSQSSDGGTFTSTATLTNIVIE